MTHSSGGIAAAYKSRVSAGEIRQDAIQLELAGRLDALAADLAQQSRPTLLARLFGSTRTAAPRGLYIVGDVGRGKTMLMDMFYAVASGPKRRAHFHAFMGDVHERVHRARQTEPGDPIPHVAAQILKETRLLCFDEFQVTDIADAMILGRLFERLFDGGLVMVATSNTRPRDLYRNGLNRALFEPFIAMIEARCEVFDLASPTDYRLEKLKAQPVWIVPADAAAEVALDRAFERLAGPGAAVPEALHVQGRDFIVPRALSGVARFSFQDLCVEARGPADYLALARRFHTLILDAVPVLKAEDRNPTRRFVTLIDALYDNGVKLIASADSEPADLVQGGLHAGEFERTASRLFEMRSEAWLGVAHGRSAAEPAPALERDPAAG
jgi:cell division protein ZapE